MLSRRHELIATFMSYSPFIFGCEGSIITPKECAFFRKSQPFGFILFARNLDNINQINSLCQSLRDATGRYVPIMVDQEGGRVARLGEPHWFEFPRALDQSKNINAERLFWLRGRLIAENLRLSGIDVNCAPLGDIAKSDTHPFLNNRCYGTNRSTVVANAHAFNLGQRHGGVSGVLKHFPGHGRAKLDSHVSLPKIITDRSVLEETDFQVFNSLQNFDMGMTAHVIYTDIDPENSATHSNIINKVIRNNIGFRGLLMTDDISMNALQNDLITRSKKAFSAGCDVVLHCNGKLEEMELLYQNSTQLSGQSLNRAEAVIKNRPAVVSIDISQLKEEFTALINE
jgi:beta-N-acetylhexosaminidase